MITSLCICLIAIFSYAEANPNIVLIVADDLGWNDVGYHGSNQIPTPNIDALAYNGIMLNRFYTHPTCTPSRAALLTGQYPIRFGLQGYPIAAGSDCHLPINVTTLPEKLKELGYATYLIGKWHLGSARQNETPTKRGFDYYFGYWNGYIGYFNHEAEKENMHGLDMHENLKTMWSTQYEYATTLFTKKSEEIISRHDGNKPFFLMLSHLAGHTGDQDKFDVPSVEENERKFNYIENKNRRLYAGVINELDKSVGAVVQALQKKGILENTIIVFISDNGGQTWGLHQNWGSNWPLRGIKFTVMEGGVRNVGLLYYSKLKSKGVVNDGLVHISDLMPTLYCAAGGDVGNLNSIDGINQWHALMNEKKSNRFELLVHIDEVHNTSAFIEGRYKLVNGSSQIKGYDGFYGDSGRGVFNPIYNISEVIYSSTNKAINPHLSAKKILKIRRANNLETCRKQFQNYDVCNNNNLCLFDIVSDPCETTNIADEYPFIVERLSKHLLRFWKEVKPQQQRKIDPRANPIYYNNTWTTWLEYDPYIRFQFN